MPKNAREIQIITVSSFSECLLHWMPCSHVQTQQGEFVIGAVLVSRAIRFVCVSVDITLLPPEVGTSANHRSTGHCKAHGCLL